MPIDVLLIDGDHSFEGALRDIEVWGPKLKSGGVLVFDDIDDIAEMRELDALLQGNKSVMRAGAVGGTAVYVMQEGGWAFLSQLREQLAKRGLHRPWSYDQVHTMPLSDRFRRTCLYNEPVRGEAYDVAYLGVRRKGDCGVMAESAPALFDLARSVFLDRGIGDFRVISDEGRYASTSRAVVSPLARAADAACLLGPGGVLIVWQKPPLSTHEIACMVGHCAQPAWMVSAIPAARTGQSSGRRWHPPTDATIPHRKPPGRSPKRCTRSTGRADK